MPGSEKAGLTLGLVSRSTDAQPTSPLTYWIFSKTIQIYIIILTVLGCLPIIFYYTHQHHAGLFVYTHRIGLFVNLCNSNTHVISTHKRLPVSKPRDHRFRSPTCFARNDDVNVNDSQYQSRAVKNDWRFICHRTYSVRLFLDNLNRKLHAYKPQKSQIHGAN